MALAKSQKSLKAWTKQKWRTKSGKPSTQGPKATGERYLPEKAIKALLIKYGIEFPYTHNIAELLTLLEEVAQPVPDFVRKSAGLTRFAVTTRYPLMFPPIKQEEYEQALTIAEQVVRWAEEFVSGRAR